MKMHGITPLLAATILVCTLIYCFTWNAVEARADARMIEGIKEGCIPQELT